jgi:hypothetical protein
MSAIRIALFGAFCWALAVPAFGQESAERPQPGGTPLPEAVLPQSPGTYGLLEAGNDAYLRGEAARRDAIGRQLQTGADIAWYYGQPPGFPNLPGIEAAYAGPRWHAPPIFGPLRAYRLYNQGYPIFEPWPFVPGDIYGSPYFGRVPQPLGHEVVRTGPDGYVYRPIYGPELEQGEVPPVEPPPARAEPIPAPLPEAAPREF